MGIKRPLIILGSTVSAVAAVLSYHPAASGSAAAPATAPEPATDVLSPTSTSTPTPSPTESETPQPTTAPTSETKGNQPTTSKSAAKPKKSSGSGGSANATTGSQQKESAPAAPTPESAPAPSGKVAKDQSVTGATADTRWGPVQVQITVKDGKIVGAVGLQYPNGDRRSQWISEQAIPWLVEETLAEQIADVQIIGGATYTSMGWRQSLASAMQKAGL